MRKLSFIVLLVVGFAHAFAQSPHGDDFKLDCAICHSPDSWELLVKEMTFDHNQTGFVLADQHQFIDCRSCHITLKFSEAKAECISCHTDMHNNTLGMDCDRCHTPKTWIVENTTEMHQQGRFPLMGSHTTADCFQCHVSASNLQFEPLSIECVSCHQADYLATTVPNHQQSGYSTNCTDCHSVKSVGWSSANFEHNFFPLRGGHAISCAQCHVSGTFGKIDNACVSCHQPDYNAAQNPNHQQSGFSVSCAECHSLDPGWKPAEFKQHDAMFFPIYSGSHGGEWTNCMECHTNTSNYAEFTCVSCHEHNLSSTDDHHKGISGYSYKSNLCFACHPQGRESGAFNHSSTGFPLIGSHTSVDCNSCHTDGFSGLSSECVSCHLADYNQTTNPGHQNLGLAVTCENCHTTQPDWKPASFPVHNNYFELTGAHAPISSDCASCHAQNYNTTPNTCYACHTADYTNTTDPNHQAVGYPTDCTSCHGTDSWASASFNHSLTGFPLTGAHTATDCASCHNGNYTTTPNTCYACHTADYTNTTDPNHLTSGFPTDCTSCHGTDSWGGATFNHTTTGFALTGAHTQTSCVACHNGNYTNTPNTCYACHTSDYTNTTDPNHSSINFPTDCESCHSTNAWKPSTFNHDGQYFPIYSGKHNGKWNSCTDCHTVSSNFAVFSCITCHEHNQTTTDSDHSEVGNYVYNSTSCFSCHPTGNGD